MITEAGQADQIITKGDADLVMIGRELLRTPYWTLNAQIFLGQSPAGQSNMAMR